MIYVDLRGRIGNQLFIYAFAEALRQKRGGKEKIVFYDYPILKEKWINSLEGYHLDNVEYQHSERLPMSVNLRKFLLRVMYHFIKKSEYRKLADIERLFQPLLSKLGIITCQNGYMQIPTPKTKDVYVTGYFQSPKYFKGIDKQLIQTFKLESLIDGLKSKDVEQIKNRNSVCISIKVEHNVGNPIYDVCGGDYWEKAIKYIQERVENPLFFICSDNVQYVKDNLIDTTKYDTICQDKSLPVHLSLAIMGLCKHFIIGNTSFGWWAQHMSDNPDKIVVAPKPWVRIDIPFDIYEEHMCLIDVSDYIGNNSIN